MYHDGLKKRWKYQVSTRMKKAHREGQWRFPKSKGFLKSRLGGTAIINKLWNITWYAYIGASLLDPRFSVQYIGQKTTRVLEYRNLGILGKSQNIQPQYSSIPSFHHSGFSFPMIRYAGLFSNRWKKQYISQAHVALNQSDPDDSDGNTQSSWAERQTDYTGINPLICPNCDQPLIIPSFHYSIWVVQNRTSLEHL